MAEQDPPTLDYEGPSSRQSGGWMRGAKGFFLGILLGTGSSAFLWLVLGRTIFEHDKGIIMLEWPAFKLILGGLLVAFKKSRPLGAGLLVSLPIGALIIGAACAAHFRLP